MVAGRGRWWVYAAATAWFGSAVLADAVDATTAPWLICLLLVLAVAVARRGRTVVGPLLGGVALALIGAVAEPACPAPAQIVAPDLPLPRRQHPVQRLRLLETPAPRRHGTAARARWLASCRPGVRPSCRARHGTVALTLPAEAVSWGAGTQLRVLGFVHPPPGYRNPGADRTLRRWRRKGLVGRMRALGRDRVVVEGAAVDPGFTDRRRASLRRAMLALVPGRAGGLLRALAIGDRSGVDPAHMQALRRTGTAHILAVSGTHVGFVLAMALGLLRFLLRRRLLAWLTLPTLRRLTLPVLEWWLGSAVVVTYAALTGGAMSTRRAVVVTVAALAIRAAGTRPAAIELLGAAAILALWFDPQASHDAGLSLSLLGAFGALTGSRLPVRGGVVARVFAVSCAAWAATALVSVPLFGQLPLLAPFINLLVVPYAGLVLLPVALLTLLCASVLPWLQLTFLPGSLTSSVASLVPSILRPLAKAALLPIDALAAIGDWPCLEVGGADGWLIGGGMAAALVLVRRWPHRKLAVGLCLAMVVTTAVIVRPKLSLPPHGAVDVHFLDVGHGDAALLRFADGTTMLIDAGGEVDDDGRVGRAAVLPLLRTLGIRRIDHMVLSHAHPDHENGLLAIARAMPVGTLWFNGLGNHSREHRALMAVLQRRGTRWLQRGDLAIAGVKLTTLWPPRAGPVPNLGLNDNSLVLQVETIGGRILFAGDVERRAEARLVASARLGRVDVLKVPHHGSRTSSTPPFLRVLKPRIAIAGARSWGQLPFPHADVAARYARLNVPLWRTEKGMVTARLGVAGVTLRQGQRTAWLPARGRLPQREVLSARKSGRRSATQTAVERR